MDFIDKLASLFGSKSNKSHHQYDNYYTDEGRRPIQIKSEKPKEANSVKEVNVEKKLSRKVYIANYITGDIPKVDTTFNKILKFDRKNIADSVVDVSGARSYNDIIAEKNEIHGLRKNGIVESVEQIIPFLKTKTNFNDWIYNNRRGVIVTMVVYLIILLSIQFVTISISGPNLLDGIYVELPSYQEVIPERKEIIKEHREIEEVENVLVDENTELNASLDDNRNTEVDELYNDAYDAQQELEANRKTYESGLKSVADIKDEYIKEQDKKQKESSEKSKKEEALGQNVATEGNVTASYDLKDRYVIRYEIPSYRCKGGGKVVVKISVDREGEVNSAVISALYHVDDECLFQMALLAAKNTIFNIDQTAPKKQIGHITFIFVAQ